MNLQICVQALCLTDNKHISLFPFFLFVEKSVVSNMVWYIAILFKGQLYHAAKSTQPSKIIKVYLTRNQMFLHTKMKNNSKEAKDTGTGLSIIQKVASGKGNE